MLDHILCLACVWNKVTKSFCQLLLSYIANVAGYSFVRKKRRMPKNKQKKTIKVFTTIRKKQILFCFENTVDIRSKLTLVFCLPRMKRIKNEMKYIFHVKVVMRVTLRGRIFPDAILSSRKKLEP